MRKLIVCTLIAVFALSFAVTVEKSEAKAQPWKGKNLIQCVWRCHTLKGILYNCCRVVMEGGGGKYTCTEIGTCDW